MLLSTVIALVICAVSSASGQGSSVCPGAPDVSCQAFSSLVIQTTSGACSATTSSDCLAASNSQDSYVQAFRDWFGSGSEGQCTSGVINSAAQAVATASAEVWSAATSTVTCTSGGFGCGFSISNGAAFSESIAEAVAQAAAEAGAGSAFCYADIRAIAKVFAEAYATSKSEACSTGGTAKSFSQAYAQEVKEAIASAFAVATAQSCQGMGIGSSASSLCEGTAQSSGTFSAGDACAGVVASREKTCEGNGRDTCCSDNFRGIRCFCSGCNGPWIKTSGGSTPAFRDADGNNCRCPSASLATIVVEEPSPPVCDCDDVQPPGIFSCLEQKNYEKCEASWMTQGQYCRKTCGKCNCDEPEQTGTIEQIGVPEEAGAIEECSCVDVLPTFSYYSCEEQKFFGKCAADWMIRNKWCEATCGRCSCAESPSTPDTIEEIAPPEGCKCSDHPPPCKRFTCVMQRVFGKCEASWMLATDKYPGGYCQFSCGRCPCKNPERGAADRPSCP